MTRGYLLERSSFRHGESGNATRGWKRTCDSMHIHVVWYFMKDHVVPESQGSALHPNRSTRHAEPETRRAVIRATCSPWQRHRSSSNGVGIRVSLPVPVTQLAP